MAGDFSVIVDPYLWKRLKNYDDDQCNSLLYLLECACSSEQLSNHLTLF